MKDNEENTVTTEAIKNAVADNDAFSEGALERVPPEDKNEYEKPEPAFVEGDEDSPGNTAGTDKAGDDADNTDAGEGEGGKQEDGKDELPAEDLEMAKSFGLSEDDAKALGKTGVSRYLSAMSKGLAQFGLTQSGQQTSTHAGTMPEGTDQISKSAQTQGQNNADDPWQFKNDLDPETYDEKVVKQGGHMEFLTSEVRKLRDYIEVQRMQAEEQQFDTAIDALPEGYRDLFGSGRGTALDRESDHFKNRVEVFKTMQALRSGYQKLGRQVGDDVLFKQALRASFGDKEVSIAKKQISDQLKRDQAGRFIARPTGRKLSPDSDKQMSPKQRAILAVRQMLSEFGKDEND